MKRDAKEHEGEDKKKKEQIDIKNQADSLVFQSEKQLKEFDAKLSAEMKMKIQTAVDRLKETLKGTNTDEMKSAIEALNAAWNEASTQMYSQTTGGAEGSGPKQEGFSSQGEQPGTESQAGTDDKKVENADFEVVDDNDKK